MTTALPFLAITHHDLHTPQMMNLDELYDQTVEAPLPSKSPLIEEEKEEIIAYEESDGEDEKKPAKDNVRVNTEMSDRNLRFNDMFKSNNHETMRPMTAALRKQETD